MTTQSFSKSQAHVSVNSRSAALLALLFGAFLVIGAGLAQSETLHNAAHDTRHAFGFPCH